MSPLHGSNDENAAYWHLPRLHELGVLQEGEITCEVEGAMHGSDPGVLVVSDLAVHFVSRGLLRPSASRVVSIALEDVESADIRESELLRGHGYGAIVVYRRRRPDDPEPRDVGKRPRYAELLDEGETCFEHQEDVSLGWRTGSLFVTDRRVAYFMGGVLWPHRCVVSMPFDADISTRVLDEMFGTTRLVVDYGPDLEHRGFVLADSARAEELARAIRHCSQRWRSGPALPPPASAPPVAGPVRVVFDAITGGRERAQEIVDTILRQKEYLEQLGPRSDGPGEPEAEEVKEEEAPELRVALGRGVAAWVEANGGRLFVWGDDFGTRFDWMKASIDPPDGVGFVRASAGTEFELYVERGLVWSRPIRLDRRWFGLRGGIAVDTGLGPR